MGALRLSQGEQSRFEVGNQESALLGEHSEMALSMIKRMWRPNYFKEVDETWHRDASRYGEDVCQVLAQSEKPLGIRMLLKFVKSSPTKTQLKN